MATRNERKRRAKAKADAIQAQINSMVAAQAARLAERDDVFQRLAEYPTFDDRPIQRQLDAMNRTSCRGADFRDGKVQARAGKRKFVSTARPYVEPLKPTPDKVPYGTARKRWL